MATNPLLITQAQEDAISAVYDDPCSIWNLYTPAQRQAYLTAGFTPPPGVVGIGNAPNACKGFPLPTLTVIVPGKPLPPGVVQVNNTPVATPGTPGSGISVVPRSGAPVIVPTDPTVALLAGLSEVGLGGPQPRAFTGTPTPSPRATSSSGVSVDTTLGLYIDTLDTVQCNFLSTIDNVTVFIKGRILTPGGQISPIDYTANAGPAGSGAQFAFNPGPCYLLSLSVNAGVNWEDGESCHAWIGVLPTPPLLQLPYIMLISGLLDGFVSRSWPGTRLAMPWDEDGPHHTDGPFNPGAGILTGFNASGFGDSEIIAVSTTLHTSGAAGARQLGLKYTNSVGKIMCQSSAPTAQNPSTVVRYSAGPALPAATAADGSQTIALPLRLTLRRSDLLFFTCVNFDAGDTLVDSMIHYRLRPI
jgi:hypothetical protein